MKKIPLTKGYFALVDDEDESRVLALGKWQAVINKCTSQYYAVHSTGKGNVRMHRFILDTPKGMVCDHVNRDTLDNQKSNLRNCSYSQNNQNQKTHKDSKTNKKSITLLKNGDYEVRVRKLGVTVYRKTFKLLAEAIDARDENIKKYHGEFARTE